MTQNPPADALQATQSHDTDAVATDLPADPRDAEIASLRAQRDAAVALLKAARTTGLALAAQIDRALVET